MRTATEFEFNRYLVDLSAESVRFDRIACEDLEDVLGGVARATKLLDSVVVDDPYDPSAPLVMNVGLLTGSRVMTGLRTFFHGYSPLKASLSGAPGLMWSAGSGHFGTKLRGLGIDDVVFTGRCAHPTLLRLSPAEDPTGMSGPVRFEFIDASELIGMRVNAKIQHLHGRYPDAHFAVIGPSGEQFEGVRFASVALSTDNQLKTGDPKPRFCGRGGYGSVMGSKNLLAIAADGPDPSVRARGLKEVNREINLGEGSKGYREDGSGGTWRMVELLHYHGGLPEYNFAPPGTEDGEQLTRNAVEAGPYVVSAEGCYLCGIKCHKNVYNQTNDGEAGDFRAKVDYEPLALLTSNLGIYDADTALDLIELVDELGMDSISLGVTLGYVMEWNRRHPEASIADGLAFGDAVGTIEAIKKVAAGDLAEIGQGSLRLATQTGEAEYAMQSKGVEYPAYLPHTNPAYPWALAGGHMSMRTYLLALTERKTDIDYWVDATTNRGPRFMLDDITGLCKFSLLDPSIEAEAIRIATGLDVSAEDLLAVVDRTFVRGYANERRSGFVSDDYSMPTDAFHAIEHSTVPQFLTEEFFEEFRDRVMEILDDRAVAAGLL
ncbi:MAG: aldehyde ferredoxin oxidoreductase C-terminal domain-containing protein [Actinomycetota bacterium]